MKSTGQDTTDDRLLTAELLKLVQELTAQFGPKRKELLAAREDRRARLRAGQIGRSEETRHIRDAKWTVAPVPMELLERRVELLTGSTRPEIIAGLNSGAKSCVIDLWNMSSTDPVNMLRAHKNIERAVDGRLQYVDASGDRVRVNPSSTTRLFVGPRPLTALENSVRHAGEPVPASFFDLAVLASYNAVKLRVRQAGVFLYLRNVCCHQEAALWKHLFEHLEDHLSLPQGTFRATVMLDSLSIALEADEVLFELNHHSAGLSLDPQAYAADHLALYSSPDGPVFPDREHIGLNAHFLRSVSLMAISTCHKRQAHAIGAPSFVLPPDENGKARPGWLDMIADKEREAVDGHDGTLVTHPGQVNPAMTEFNKSMPRSHQMYYERKDNIGPDDLTKAPTGPISTESLLGSVRTVLKALVLRESGEAVIEQAGRLHDRSSVRLSTLLLWQWTRSSKGFVTDTGLEIHDELTSYLIKKEADKLFGRATSPAKDRAVEMFKKAMLSAEVPGDLLG
jgi:malate synthase